MIIFYPLEFEKLLEEIDGTDLIYFNLRWNTGRELVLALKINNIFVGAVKLVRRNLLKVLEICQIKELVNWFFIKRLQKESYKKIH